MNTVLGWSLSLTFFLFGISINDGKTPVERQERQVNPASVNTNLSFTPVSVTAAKPQIVFKHGDISWLPELALRAGWNPKHLPRLGEIILRESGGCPNRRGGDAVDANCNITKVLDRSHRSDTGLLQINGVNYDTSRNKWAAVCNAGIACSQEILLDPLVNLQVGLVLFEIAGWGPWDLCTWGPDYAHRCNKKTKS